MENSIREPHIPQGSQPGKIASDTMRHRRDDKVLSRGTLFGCADINFECKNISLSSDIGRITLSTEQSEHGIPKKSCSNVSRTE